MALKNSLRHGDGPQQQQLSKLVTHVEEASLVVVGPVVVAKEAETEEKMTVGREEIQ